MSTSFTRTREQIADLVLGKIQNVRAGSAVSADMLLVYEAIDLRLKELHALGVFWRKVDEVQLSFTITAGTKSASATADILFPISLNILDNSREFAVSIVDPLGYAQIAEKEQQGVPQKALWKGSAEFLFWPIPVNSTTAKLVYEKLIDDTAAGTAPDVEVSMMRCLSDIVKSDVAEHFGVDEQRIIRWLAQVPELEKRIRKLSVSRADYRTVGVDNFDDAPVDHPATSGGYLNNDYVE